MSNITSAHLDLLTNFQGYGPDHPTIVFMGQEEMRGTGQEATAEILQRCSLIKDHPRRGDKDEFGMGGPWLEPGKVPQWKFASHVVSAIANHDCSAVSPVPDPLIQEERWKTEYKRLGSHTGFTLLTERMPFPLNGNDRRDISESYLGRWFSTPTEIWNDVKESRLAVLKEVAAQSSVQWVFLYGIPYRNWKHSGRPLYKVILDNDEDMESWPHVQLKKGVAYFNRINGRIVVSTGFWGKDARVKHAVLIHEIPDLISHVVQELGNPC